MLGGMAKAKKKAAQVVAGNGSKGRPRTVRLSHDDESWVDGQEHPEGFTGVIVDAVRFYREHKDQQRRALLEAVS